MRFIKAQMSVNRALGVSKRVLGARLLGWFPIAAFFNFFELGAVGGLSIRPADALFMIVGTVFIVTVLSGNRIDKMSVMAIFLLGGFFLSALFGLIYNGGIYFDPAKTLRLVQTMSWGIFAAYFIRSEDELLRLVYRIIIVGAVTGLVGGYFFITVAEVHRIAAFYTVAGGEGFEGQASFNELGAFCAFSAALAIVLVFQKRHTTARTYWFLLLGAASASMGLILTQSRSGLLALVIALVVFFAPRILSVLKTMKVTVRSIWSAMLILVGSMVGVIFLQSFATINRITGSFRAGSNEYESAMTRLSLWQQGIEYFVTDPSLLIIGHGGRWLPLAVGSITFENYFLDTAVAYSLLGLFITLAYWAYPIVVARRYSTKHNWLCSMNVVALVVVVVVGIFGNVAVDPFFGGAIFLILYGTGSTILAEGNRL
jgi:hypothetical protein